MFIDTDAMNNTNLFPSGKSAGKVNFNTSSSNDYLTSESFKTLRTNILFCGADIKTIVITSARENEGKPFTIRKTPISTLFSAVISRPIPLSFWAQSVLSSFFLMRNPFTIMLLSTLPRSEALLIRLL